MRKIKCTERDAFFQDEYGYVCRWDGKGTVERISEKPICYRKKKKEGK